METSIWLDGVDFPAFPKLEEELKTDVLVIGGGLAGLLCAHRLQNQGAEVALIEADRIGRGASALTTAKITSQHGAVYAKLLRDLGYDRARAYWEANEAALQALCALGDEYSCDLERTDSYLYATADREMLEQEADALRNLGIPHEAVSRVRLPMETAGAIRFWDQAQFNPAKLMAQLAGDLRIYEKTRALELDGNRVITDRGCIRADKIIVASHFPVFNKRGGYFLRMYQQRSYVLALENIPKVDGMYLDISGKGFSFRSYGNALLLGGGSHRTGKKGRGWTDLERLKLQCCSDARELCRWANQDCMTLDGVPYIGRYSRSLPHVFVATGFNKWGMTASMLSAMILADLVQDRANPYEPVFTPQRSSLGLQLLTNGLESAVNLLTPTKPRCTHLGCALKWNPWEHSWDCPCHGSRFTKEGSILNGPAKKDM